MPTHELETSTCIGTVYLILTGNCTTADMAVVPVKPVDKCWDME
jgi:hypothetical protein